MQRPGGNGKVDVVQAHAAFAAAAAEGLKGNLVALSCRYQDLHLGEEGEQLLDRRDKRWDDALVVRDVGADDDVDALAIVPLLIFCSDEGVPPSQLHVSDQLAVLKIVEEETLWEVVDNIIRPVRRNNVSGTKVLGAEDGEISGSCPKFQYSFSVDDLMVGA